MPLGQFTPGRTLEEAQVVFDNYTTFNRGLTAGRTVYGAPKAALGVGAGTTISAIGAVTGSDFAGNFTVTAGSTPTAGTLATVKFGTQLAAAPSSVIVNCSDNSGGTGLAAAANSLASTGFSVVTAAGTYGDTYTVTYLVVQ